MSKALRAFMVKLAYDLDALTAFMSNPKEVLAAADLSDEERAALLSGDQQRIYQALHPERAQAAPPPPAAPAPGVSTYTAAPWAAPAPPPFGYPPPGYPLPFGYPPQGAAPFPGAPPPFPGYPPVGPAPNHPGAPAQPQHSEQSEEGSRVR
jgi:hypothetical protein